jgi:hypothetical protein
MSIPGCSCCFAGQLWCYIDHAGAVWKGPWDCCCQLFCSFFIHFSTDLGLEVLMPMCFSHSSLTLALICQPGICSLVSFCFRSVVTNDWWLMTGNSGSETVASHLKWERDYSEMVGYFMCGLNVPGGDAPTPTLCWSVAVEKGFLGPDHSWMMKQQW